MDRQSHGKARPFHDTKKEIDANRGEQNRRSMLLDTSTEGAVKYDQEYTLAPPAVHVMMQFLPDEFDRESAGDSVPCPSVAKRKMQSWVIVAPTANMNSPDHCVRVHLAVGDNPCAIHRGTSTATIPGCSSVKSALRQRSDRMEPIRVI